MHIMVLPACAYTPYGHAVIVKSQTGFNGEFRDPFSGFYLLGNGYRAFTPALMRFNRPDELSPFAQGGINAYAYCSGDPINRKDPSGASIFGFLKEAAGHFSDAFIRNKKPGAVQGQVLNTPSAQKIINAENKTFFSQRVAGAFTAKDSNGAPPLPSQLQHGYEVAVKASNAGEISSTSGHLRMISNWLEQGENGSKLPQPAIAAAVFSHSLAAASAGGADIADYKTGAYLRRRRSSVAPFESQTLNTVTRGESS